MLAVLLMLVVLLGSASAISQDERNQWNVFFGVPVEQDVDKFSPSPKFQPTFRSIVTVHETPIVTRTAYLYPTDTTLRSVVTSVVGVTLTSSSDVEPTFAEDEVATSTYSVEPTVSEKKVPTTQTQEPATWPTHATIMSTLDSLPESYQWCLKDDFRRVNEDGEWSGMFFGKMYRSTIPEFCAQKWNWKDQAMAPFRNHGLHEMLFWRLECCIGMKDHNNGTAKRQAADWLKEICPNDFSSEQYQDATKYKKDRFHKGICIPYAPPLQAWGPE